MPEKLSYVPDSHSSLLRAEKVLKPLRGLYSCVPLSMRQPIARILRGGNLRLNTVRHISFGGAEADFLVRRHIEALRVQVNYEPELLQSILVTLKDYKDAGCDCNFVNVGAAEGLYTVLGARFASKVYSFEPDIECLASLYHNVELNRLNNVTIFPFALGSYDGEARFYIDPKRGNAASLQRTYDQDCETLVAVRKYISLNCEGVIETPDVMLIDVEGAEAEVLKGMGEVRPNHLFIELHRDYLPVFGSSVDEVMDIVGNLGYSADFAVRRKAELQVHFVHRNGCN